MSSFSCQGSAIYFARMNPINNEQIHQQSIKLNDKGSKLYTHQHRRVVWLISLKLITTLFWIATESARLLTTISRSSLFRSQINLCICFLQSSLEKNQRFSCCFLVPHSMKAVDTSEIVEEQRWRFGITGFDQWEAGNVYQLHTTSQILIQMHQ